MDGLYDDLLDQMFDFMVCDFSKFALFLYEHPTSSKAQMVRKSITEILMEGPNVYL